MTEKTEALRLAEQLEAIGLHGPVAAELRRLHAEVERLSLDGIHSCHAECQRPVCRLTRERDALLEALKRTASIIDKMGDMPDGFIHPSPWQTLKCEEALEQARAAIKQVEEGQ